MALIPWLQQVYKSNFINVLEGSFVINIIDLFITTYHFIIQEYENCQLIVFYISICVAFIEFLAILLFHAWHRLTLKWLYMKGCKKYLFRRAEDCSNSSKIVSKVENLDQPGGNFSTATVFDIREPLLDDSINEL